MTQDHTTNLITKAIEDCRQRKIWGQLAIDFQNGKPTVLRIAETTKLYKENDSYNERKQ